MVRSFFIFALVFLFSTNAQSEQLIFEGKTFCKSTQEIYSPHSGDASAMETVALMRELEAGKGGSFNDESIVRPPFVGAMNIVKVMIEVGSEVKHNQDVVEYSLPPDIRGFEIRNIDESRVLKIKSDLSKLQLNLKRKKEEEHENRDKILRGSASKQSQIDIQTDINILELQIKSVEEMLRLDSEYNSAKFGSAKSNFGAKTKKPREFPRTGFLKSQINGHVLWKNPELTPGGVITRPTRLLRLGDLSFLTLSCWAPDRYRLLIKPGEKVVIAFASLPGIQFEGKINRILSAAEQTETQLPSMVYFHIDLPNPDLLLKEGMRATVTINPS